MTIFLAVLAILAVIILLAISKPNTFQVDRSVEIETSAANIFAYISELRAWQDWSPYETKDPTMQRSYNNVTSGVGATYEWRGNNKVGEGRMEIVEAKNPVKIVIALEFIKPMAGNNTAIFNLNQSDNATKVTWNMYGPSPFVSKLMQVFINFDTMIGKDFESGLSQLKLLVENKPEIISSLQN